MSWMIRWLAAAVIGGQVLTMSPALAQEPQHAIAMHGNPALPADFTHFPYADPDAPKGGTMTYGVVGTFDSLNPFVLKSMRTTARGLWDPEFGKLVFESLMVRSADEPYSLYPGIARSVRLPEDRAWMEFEIDPRARWADGVPITPEDVIFTYEILRDKGRPPFSSRMNRIAAIEKTGERTVKFTFNEQSDREFPLIVAASTPVLPRHATDPASFGDSTLTPPVGSGPYRIAEVVPGQSITYQRRPDYWGDALPAHRGVYNHERVRIEYFKSVQAQFEAFKKGVFDVYREGDPAHWTRAYDFPAVTGGEVVKEQLENGMPPAMQAFVFNTRRPVFADRRVRAAIASLFDFEWINRNLFFDAYRRTGSFWHGSDLSFRGHPADERERAFLAARPSVSLDPAVLDGTWQPATSDGSGRDRKLLRAALAQLTEAGFRREGSRLVGPDGRPLAFEILVKTDDEEKLAVAFARTLALAGIEAGLRQVDDAQFQQRLGAFDYDIVFATYGSSLSPGAEQSGRWSSAAAGAQGSFAYAGVSDPVVDEAIQAIVAATDREAFVSAVRLLDRLLIGGHYVVPLYHLPGEWIAHWSRQQHPERTPLLGVQFPTWWDTRAAAGGTK